MYNENKSEFNPENGDFDVIQRTSDGMFNATILIKQWNEYSGQQKQIVHYLENDATKEFIVALCEENDIDYQDFVKERNSVKNSLSRIYTKKRGIEGGTWMHPLLFIDFAMWLNPAFKVKVLKFVYDELIRYRNEAGDAYKEMSSAVAKIVPGSFMPTAIQKVAQALNFIVYNQHESEIRNKQADESKVRELAELEKDVAKLIGGGFIKHFDHLISYLRERWAEKYTPKALTGHKP